ncbi:MAG: hypothetical protein JWR26_1668 [Pedosphaera sp.]|nr:hypothetical protein [Pedosphaera sp.]
MANVKNIVKFSTIILLASLLITGCATTNTVATRKQERIAAYQALPPEMKASVDQGQLKAGMNMDAVYIAWGQPSQTVKGGDETGETTTWIYNGGYVQETRYWGYRRVHYDYYPTTYVRAQVTFSNGVVKQWQTFPEPVY